MWYMIYIFKAGEKEFLRPFPVSCILELCSQTAICINKYANYSDDDSF